ncbi:MAG: BamA/TamA family outer membrane protein [Burkholderiales bacterium]
MRSWLFALTLAALAPTCNAQTPAVAGAPTDAAGTTAADVSQATADDLVRYRVDVVAPTDVASALRSAVDLIRWQDYEEMTEDLFARLVRDAVAQAKEAAATQGFFSATVDIRTDRSVKPVRVSLTVTPGRPTTVASVAIDVQGPANDSPEGRAAIDSLREAWLLPKGETWRQQTWTSAKNLAVSTLAASPYAAARMASSEARIDPAQASADLSVTLDSGPPFRIGLIDIQGLSRYSPEMVRNFATVQAGDLYSAKSFDDYVRRLLASNYFASAQVSIDTDVTRADHATVTLSLIEAPTKRVEFGAGYSTDTEYRVSASYSDVNLDGNGLQLWTSARIESKIQQVDVRFVRPPTPTGWIDTYGGGVQRTDIENLITRTAAVTARRRAIDEWRIPAFGIGFYANDQAPLDAPATSSHALYVDAEYTWRNTDDILEPTRGWMANVQAGYGIPGASTEQFGRLIGRIVGWWPFTRSDQLVARFDVGAVLAQSRVGIPSVFLFRTGGDTTVRGYAFESLGVQEGSAIVGGRYYAVGSVEAIHWINRTWGIAAFVDAGNATDQVSNIDPAFGFGVGARFRTPIGPFRLDIAYGERDQQVRVHFSVGLTF